MRTLALLAFLPGCCGCLTLGPPPPSPPQPQPIAAVEAAPAPQDKPAAVAQKPIASVNRDYTSVARKEMPAISAVDVTAEYVRLVHRLDNAARSALRQLETKRTLVALEQARAAVIELDRVLQEGP